MNGALSLPKLNKETDANPSNWVLDKPAKPAEVKPSNWVAAKLT